MRIEENKATPHSHLPARIKRNLVVHEPATDAYYRILYVDPAESASGEGGYWIRIDSDSNVPLPFCLPNTIEPAKPACLRLSSS